MTRAAAMSFNGLQPLILVDNIFPFVLGGYFVWMIVSSLQISVRVRERWVVALGFLLVNVFFLIMVEFNIGNIVLPSFVIDLYQSRYVQIFSGMLFGFFITMVTRKRSHLNR